MKSPGKISDGTDAPFLMVMWKLFSMDWDIQDEKILGR